ncbi:GPW/gp25 family protein [bacterium]|nr:GPW/gp25 family protein [bacterium]
MARESFINIKFPFKDSEKGLFIDMTQQNKRAIKSDLMHLLLTNKGERLYQPEFGTDLKKYLFEPNIVTVQSNIRDEIQKAIDKYIPNLKVDRLEVNPVDGEEHSVIVKLEYTVTNNTFSESDFLTIEL